MQAVGGQGPHRSQAQGAHPASRCAAVLGSLPWRAAPHRPAAADLACCQQAHTKRCPTAAGNQDTTAPPSSPAVSRLWRPSRAPPCVHSLRLAEEPEPPAVHTWPAAAAMHRTGPPLAASFENRCATTPWSPSAHGGTCSRQACRVGCCRLCNQPDACCNLYSAGVFDWECSSEADMRLHGSERRQRVWLALAGAVRCWLAVQGCRRRRRRRRTQLSTHGQLVADAHAVHFCEFEPVRAHLALLCMRAKGRRRRKWGVHIEIDGSHHTRSDTKTGRGCVDRLPEKSAATAGMAKRV